ncbi:MAG: adenine phosphoribosyltransferase [Cytophagaceae bacterium]
MLSQEVKLHIKDIPDFPKKGIIFKDITPVFLRPDICKRVVNEMASHFTNEVDAVAGLESRGFLLGMMLAEVLNVPFIPVRKEGKLPGDKNSKRYCLEYGEACIEIQKNVIQPDWNILIHDDLLATGGTASAASQLIMEEGAHVAGYAFMIDLAFLHGKEKLKTYSDNIVSIVEYH